MHLTCTGLVDGPQESTSEESALMEASTYVKRSGKCSKLAPMRV